MRLIKARGTAMCLALFVFQFMPTNPEITPEPSVIERRSVTIRELRASSDDNAMKIDGYAAVFNELSEEMFGFREMLISGCFTEAIKISDPRCLFNHDSNYVLGRLLARTLRLKEDMTGLKFDCDLPDTQIARDLVTSIKRGDVTQCSFAFLIDRNDSGATEWVVTDDIIIRKIYRVKYLYDVSPVTYPAYPQTSVSAEARTKCTELQTQRNPNADQVTALAHEQVRQMAIQAHRARLQLAEL